MANLGAQEFQELVVATLRKIEPELYDNVMLKHPTLDLLRDEEKSETGRAMVVPLELGLNNSTTLTDKSGTFSTAKSDDIIGAAEYQWSDPIVSHVRLNWKDLQENQGSQKQISLLKKHIRNMQYSHGRKLVEFLHNRADLGQIEAGTDKGQYHSFDQVVSDADYDANPTGAAAGAETPFTVGGIDASTQPLWQAQRIELAQDDTTYGSGNIRKAFRHIENEVAVKTSNKNRIDTVICGRLVFEEFVDSFDDKVRYTDFKDGQAKFKEVKHGDLVIRLDPDCPPRRAYFLDRKTWQFRSLAGNFMKSQPAQFIPGTLDSVTPAASVISVGVNERRANGLLLRPTTAGGDA